MRGTFHVSLIVFPLRLIIKKCVDQTRGLYQIRPGKANYTDNNLSVLLPACLAIQSNKYLKHDEQGKPGHLNRQCICKYFLVRLYSW